ncbi:MAG: hypothetical protein EOS07_32435 [Mesorhizobium sp.]|nr:MAG: hypothetical protein EOS07_32435 [Mesorhizobium sp.]
MNKPADVSFVAGTTSTYDSMLARFGGTPAVPTGSVTPWPAPQKRHSKALKSVVTSGKYHRVNHPIVTAAEERSLKMGTRLGGPRSWKWNIRNPYCSRLFPA